MTRRSKFHVMGISLRTDNKKALVQIPGLWERFYRENVLQLIPNRVSDDVYALYTDYETDENGPYTLVIGCAVENFETVPQGFVVKEVPAAHYKVFSAKGQMPNALIEAWQEIWGTDLPRTYTGDYEMYGAKFHNITPEVDIFIAREKDGLES